jgi:hypothetical protein
VCRETPRTASDGGKSQSPLLAWPVACLSRRWKGTPAQRQLSISNFGATNVSVVELGATFRPLAIPDHGLCCPPPQPRIVLAPSCSKPPPDKEEEWLRELPPGFREPHPLRTRQVVPSLSASRAGTDDWAPCRAARPKFRNKGRDVRLPPSPPRRSAHARYRRGAKSARRCCSRTANHQILNRLRAKVMIDTVDLRFFKHFLDRVVSAPDPTQGRGQKAFR